jgi:hypothetical protein
MIIRTLRPCEVAGRTVAPGLLLDLPEHQANALVDAGDAEPTAMQPPAAEPAPAPAETQE